MTMTLPEFGVKRPITTLMLFLGILTVGLIALSLLPIDMFPKIDIPSLGVITMYQGAGAEDIESKVTRVIEEQVSTVPDIKEVSSTSMEGISAVTLRFEWGTDLNAAASDVRQKLDFAQLRLPDEIDRPMLVKFDFSMMPVMFLGVTAEESYQHLYDLVDKGLCDPLKRVPGVAMASIRGGLEREIHVNVDQHRLQAYGLSMEGLRAVLARENLSQPAGNLKVGRISYVLRVPGEFDRVAQIGDVVVGQAGGSTVHLKDIADIQDSFKEVESRVRIDRRPGIMVMVQKQSGANTVEVVDRIYAALPGIADQLPADVRVVPLMDSADFIKRSVRNLRNTIGWALLFVMLVVLLFLRDLRGSLIIATTVPFALIIDFIFLYLCGYTINMMSLSAVAIAIGMVVDNAIVVFENIHRHHTEQGESKREAAVFGATEVGLAVTASTATTVVIFVPVIFVPGITGIMFQELALAIIAALGASLFTALCLTPMLASRFLKIAGPDSAGATPAGRLRRLRRAVESRFRGMEERYAVVLGWALGHRRTVLGVGITIFAVSVAMLPVVGTEFMPTMDRGQIMGTVELPLGTRVEETDKVMSRLEDDLSRVPEISVMFARCGVSESGMGAMIGRRSDTNILTIGGRLVPKGERHRSDADIGRELAQQARRIAGVRTVDFTAEDPIQSLTSGGAKPVSVEIYGHDIDATNGVAERVREMMARVPGLTDVTISRQLGKPELWVEVDRAKASVLGLSMAQISHELRTGFSGRVATKFRQGGDEHDIFVRLRGDDRRAAADIGGTVVTTPSRRQVTIHNIADLSKRTGPVTIDRQNQERIVRVGGGVYGRDLGSIVGDIEAGLAQMDIPADIDIRIGGSAQDQAESFRWLSMALLLGIFLVYMVMASQFESFIDPFVIIFAVPFAITGVIWALLATGMTLSITSFVGMIMLVGIVVNNAIVLIDYTNILRTRGLAMLEAVQTAGRRRLRPVLMTSLTTILALLPMALSRREGSEVWSPLAVSVIGGLLVSTVVTLVFVPTLYSIVEQRIKKT